MPSVSFAVKVGGGWGWIIHLPVVCRSTMCDNPPQGCTHPTPVASFYVRDDGICRPT